jgi:hypothetical protein
MRGTVLRMIPAEQSRSPEGGFTDLYRGGSTPRPEVCPQSDPRIVLRHPEYANDHVCDNESRQHRDVVLMWRDEVPERGSLRPQLI